MGFMYIVPESGKTFVQLENLWKRTELMISFLEMTQQYPIGSKVNIPEEKGVMKNRKEIIGYEYYNGTGYLIFRDHEKVDVEWLMQSRGSGNRQNEIWM